MPTETQTDDDAEVFLPFPDIGTTVQPGAKLADDSPNLLEFIESHKQRGRRSVRHSTLSVDKPSLPITTVSGQPFPPNDPLVEAFERAHNRTTEGRRPEKPTAPAKPGQPLSLDDPLVKAFERAHDRSTEGRRD